MIYCFDTGNMEYVFCRQVLLTCPYAFVVLKIKDFLIPDSYPCRNVQYRIQRNKDESHMANAIIIPIMTYSCERWTQQRGDQETTKYFQRSTKNHPLPTPRDPNHNSHQRNRKYTNRIHHKQEANPTSKTD